MRDTEISAIGAGTKEPAAGHEKDALSHRDLLASIEEDFSRMHLILSKGLSSFWQGEACDRHQSMEEALYQEAEEALHAIRGALGRADPARAHLRDSD